VLRLERGVGSRPPARGREGPHEREGDARTLARHNDMLLAAVAVSPGGSRAYVTGLTGPFRYDYATVAYRAG
jgi:hypothetical protein